MEWKEGTKGTLYSYFARVRVRIATPDCREPEEQTLLVEWPLEEKEPKHYTLLTIPRKTKLKEMVLPLEPADSCRPIDPPVELPLSTMTGVVEKSLSVVPSMTTALSTSRPRIAYSVKPDPQRVALNRLPQCAVDALLRVVLGSR